MFRFTQEPSSGSSVFDIIDARCKYEELWIKSKFCPKYITTYQVPIWIY
jgi:hypothetical protein